MALEDDIESLKQLAERADRVRDLRNYDPMQGVAERFAATRPAAEESSPRPASTARDLRGFDRMQGVAERFAATPPSAAPSTSQQGSTINNLRSYDPMEGVGERFAASQSPSRALVAPPAAPSTPATPAAPLSAEGLGFREVASGNEPMSARTPPSEAPRLTSTPGAAAPRNIAQAAEAAATDAPQTLYTNRNGVTSTTPVPGKSPPMNNPIVNPNVASSRTPMGARAGAMSAEAADYLKTAGKIPDQVGGVNASVVDHYPKAVTAPGQPVTTPGVGAPAATSQEAASLVERLRASVGLSTDSPAMKFLGKAGRAAVGLGSGIAAIKSLSDGSKGDIEGATGNALRTIAGAAWLNPTTPLPIKAAAGIGLAADAAGNAVNTFMPGTANAIRRFVHGGAEALGADLTQYGFERPRNMPGNTVPGVAAAVDETPAEGARLARQEGATPAPAPAAAPAQSPTYRAAMKAIADEREADRDGVRDHGFTTDHRGNTIYSYAMQDGRVITPPGKFTAADAKLLEQIDVLPGQGQPNTTFEANGRTYRNAMVGVDENGMPEIKAYAILDRQLDGKYIMPELIRKVEDAKARQIGLAPEDQEAINRYRSRIDRENALGEQGGTPAQPAPAAPAPGLRAGGNNKQAFAEQYGPAAQRVADALGVDPKLVLAQWALETGWGKKVIPGTNNLGNIKSTDGKGVMATDNATGKRDPYRQFASADEFADHFTGLMERKYGNVKGAGSDVNRYTAALAGYAEDPNYAKKIAATYAELQGMPAAAAPAAAPAATEAAAPASRGGIAEAAQAELANRVVYTKDGPMVDGTFVPRYVLAGGEDAVNKYLAAAQQGANYAANPVAGKIDEKIAGADKPFKVEGREYTDEMGRRVKEPDSVYRPDSDTFRQATGEAMVQPKPNLPDHVLIARMQAEANADPTKIPSLNAQLKAWRINKTIAAQ